MVSPSRIVPFLLPRSSSVATPAAILMRACWRDTPESSTRMAASGARPMTWTPGPSGISRSPTMTRWSTRSSRSPSEVRRSRRRTHSRTHESFSPGAAIARHRRGRFEVRRRDGSTWRRRQMCQARGPCGSLPWSGREAPRPRATPAGPAASDQRGRSIRGRSARAGRDRRCSRRRPGAWPRDCTQGLLKLIRLRRSPTLSNHHHMTERPRQYGTLPDPGKRRIRWHGRGLSGP